MENTTRKLLFLHCSACLCWIETSNTASVYLYSYINPYLGDIFIIIGCQAGFHCKINLNQFACRWFIENSVDLWVNRTNCTLLKGGRCFTFAIYLRTVKLYFAIAVPPYQGAVSIMHICHQPLAHLHQIFLLLFLKVKWHIYINQSTPHHRFLFSCKYSWAEVTNKSATTLSEFGQEGRRWQLRSYLPVLSCVDYIWCVMEQHSCVGSQRERGWVYERGVGT